MRHTPSYLLEDPNEVKQLIRDNPRVTIVSNTASGLVAFHYCVVLEEDSEGVSIGRPEILAAQESSRVLSKSVDHLEMRMPHPKSLAIDKTAARGICAGTVGIRMRITRFDSDAASANRALAAEMRRVHGEPT